MSKKVVITHAKRTAIGAFTGVLSSVSATKLGSTVIKSVLDLSGIDYNIIDEVIMGNVIMAGQGQAPARQAAIYAGLPNKTEALTINKMCGSGLKSVMLAQQAINSGDADIIVAGGMESMSNAPYLLLNGRGGFRLGNQTVHDSLIYDGLWDAYNNMHMGQCAEKCGRDFNMTRQDVDDYAILSYKRAIAAQNEGKFASEIADVVISGRSGDVIVNRDEEPDKVKFDKIPTLRPAFEKDGIITAANASKLNDGASALLIMSEEKALALGLTPLVEIVSQSSFAQAPIDFTTAPAGAVEKALLKAKLTAKDIDLYELNEAFAVVALSVTKMLGLTVDNVNVNGGAIALGHPIGASGARVLTTLIHEMKRRSVELGVASLCIGGGEASAVIVKNYN